MTARSRAFRGEDREKSTARTEANATTASDPAKEFHAHLDVCERCERQPFNLCPIGARLINEAVARL